MASTTTAKQLIQKDFIENRSRVLDLAAFLDRVQRYSEPGTQADDRILVLNQALKELIKEGPGRVERVQMLLSDQSILILDMAEKGQGAVGFVKNSCC